MNKVRCPNMNHGRLNAPVKYCPNCGECVNITRVGSCNHAKHMSLLKERYTFCHDCGKKLAKS